MISTLAHGIFASAGAPAPEFTPDQLFYSGDLGDWFDYRTADGLFQDEALTEPVTASGQTVRGTVGRRGQMAFVSSTPAAPVWTECCTNQNDSIQNPSYTYAGSTPAANLVEATDVTILVKASRIASTVSGVTAVHFGASIRPALSVQRDRNQHRMNGVAKSTPGSTDLNIGRSNNFILGVKSASAPGFAVSPEGVFPDTGTATGFGTLSLDYGPRSRGDALFWITRALTEQEQRQLLGYFDLEYPDP